jgi:CheY-like chemotaxis protein
MDRRTSSNLPVEPPAVLVVEDHPLMREIIGRQLGAAGCAVRLAVDGAEALAALDDIQVDFVLSDVSMPRVDGPELARQLQSRDGAPPVVLMSADPNTNPRLPGVRFVAKPLPAEDLRRLLDELLPH